MRILSSLLLMFVLVSCSCSDNHYTKSEMYKLGVQFDSNLELILPKDMASGIQCSDYGPGCLSGHEIKVRKVTMIAVEFEEEEQACTEALRLDQYCKFNWLFDDIHGEPVLEDFVVRAFGAVRPSQQTPSN